MTVFVPNAPAAMPERLLRLREVQTMTGLSRSAIYSFPAELPRVNIGPKAVAWPLSVVQSWIQARIEAARSK